MHGIMGGDLLDISIHTPTKGATDDDKYSDCAISISIHTPTEGATQTTEAPHCLF